MSDPGSNQTSWAFAHRLRRMSGRDPHEPHRVATPLELLFDLTFVIAWPGAWAHWIVEADAHVTGGVDVVIGALVVFCDTWRTCPGATC